MSARSGRREDKERSQEKKRIKERPPEESMNECFMSPPSHPPPVCVCARCVCGIIIVRVCVVWRPLPVLSRWDMRTRQRCKFSSHRVVERALLFYKRRNKWNYCSCWGAAAIKCGDRVLRSLSPGVAVRMQPCCIWFSLYCFPSPSAAYTFQTNTQPSLPTLTSCRSSGENLSWCTQPLWPTPCARHAPLA